MGSVYLAVDERLDRDVALKVVREDLARDPTCVERFRKEARSAARLSHPHVVAVHDQGQDDDVVFLTMEFVDGFTLRDRLDAGPLSVREALDVADDLLSALSAAHRCGLIHRDVKPENVLIGPDGVVKVADFGLARAVSAQTMTTGLGGVLGTVAYLAPEQVERGIADARSDVYAAGLVLHEMLTGRPAVTGDSPIHIAYQHVHVDVPPPSRRAPGVPAALDEVVVAATSRDPDERSVDAAALRAALQAARSGLTEADLASRPDSHDKAGDPTAGRGPVDTGRVARSTRRLPLPGRSGGATAGPRIAADAAAADGSGAGGRGAGAVESGRRRRRGPLVAGILLTALLVAAWFVGIGPGSARAVPDVSGADAGSAVVSIEDAGFRTATAEEFSETVSAGDVVTTHPTAGESGHRWSLVTLVVSRGPERYRVPDVSGQAPAQAAQALQGTKLVAGAVTQAFDEQVPAGQVVAATPAVGTSVRPGTRVGLVVSRGREPLTLPDVRGDSLADVRELFAGKDVTVTVSGEEFSTSVDKGDVVSQKPGPSTIHRGDTVSVVVSKGPDLVAVPTVRGLDQQKARAALTAAGFEVKISRIAGGLFGTAHSTDPAAGAQAPRGSTVTLRVV